MTTAAQIVDGAAEEIGIKTAEIALEAADAQSIFNRMNDMLSEWADLGLTPGFNEVSNLTDTVEIDRNAVSAAKYNLGIRCAPSFQAIVTPALAELARATKEALETSTAYIGEVAYPDTLPLGSGNECNGYDLDNRFFPANKTENF